MAITIMNRTETEFKIHQLVITASNWDGKLWNQCNRCVCANWNTSNDDLADPDSEWDVFKAYSFIKRLLIDPVAKAESKNEAEHWKARWPLAIRNAAAIEIVDQMADEFELGNKPLFD